MERLINTINKKWVAVIGSRPEKSKNTLFSQTVDKQYVYNYLNSKKHKIGVIISGGAQGPDSWGEEWAKENGIPFIGFYAKWYTDNGQFDRGAGMKRNVDIIKNCDVVVAFYDGISSGTKHSIELAKSLKTPKPVILVGPSFDTLPAPIQTPIPANNDNDINPEDFVNV